MALSPMISSKALGGMPQFVLEVAGEKRLAEALNAANLPFHVVEERKGYISENSLAVFVHKAAQISGQQNIGLLWSPHLTVADYGAWGQYVLSAPTLAGALLRGAAVMPLHSSADRAWLETSGTVSRYCYHFGLRGHHAYPDIGFSAIGVFLSIFRAYLGKDWKPSAVLLDFPKVPSSAEAEITYACPVIWNAPRLGIQFETSCLQVDGVAGQTKDVVSVGDIRRECRGGPPETIAGQVAALVWHQLDRNEATIDAVAQSLDIGIRSLQRKLEGEGVQFREIVNHTLSLRAKELLSLSHVSISDIAAMLGYESSNNFSRAFKKTSGMTPTQYRRDLHSAYRSQ
ncbi:AraC family transcriptional regulator ligand-binding domain-containing protein [Shimia sp. SDUM112013]|uniref:AraC family transcriptional regulator ligand-binding domain-containing protein n=1 Tax=Shimia sp. SDUM112013 TaxID=3136160 RepID=UPI0032EDAD11